MPGGTDNDQNGLTDDLLGWDWTNNSGEAKDLSGHGTGVAGLIAAQSMGLAGGASPVPVRLMNLQVLDDAGIGDTASAVEAIDYAVAYGAQVINLSWGTEAYSAALREALARAASRAVVVVCSAGNGGRDIDFAPHYPAAYDLPNLISVASVDESDSLAAGSNWGVMRVTVAALGVDVVTTTLGGGHTAASGTSIAAAEASAVAAAIKTLYPALSVESVRAAIFHGVRPVPLLTGKIASGGVLDRVKALEHAAQNADKDEKDKEPSDKNAALVPRPALFAHAPRWGAGAEVESFPSCLLLLLILLS